MFKLDYARILSHARATRELGAYERLHTACSMNKVTTGLVPLTAGAAYAHIFKTKPTDTSKHMKAIAVVGSLAFITNIYAVYARGQIAPTEDRLIEKYVMTLDDSTLTNYVKGNRRFPNAK